MKKFSALIAVVVVSVLAYTQLTIFCVPPIGAVPEGGTIIMLRLNKTQFVDSADAMCERIQGGVNLLCRGMVLGAVAKNGTVLARLPYIDSLYLVSTGGRRFNR